MKQFGFIPIFLPFIAIGLVFVYLIYAYTGSIIHSPEPSPSPVSSQIPQSSPIDTANWETYTNNKYNFSFKYPEEKYLLKENKIIDNSPTSEYTSFFLQYCPTKKLEDCAFPSLYFEVMVYKNSLESSLEQWVSTFSRSPLKTGSCYLKDSRTTVGGIQLSTKPSIAYSYTIDETSVKGICEGKMLEGGGEYYGVITSRDKDVLVLSINAPKQDEIYQELYEILHTFKFTQ